jgi:hypothetical protein
MESVRPSTKRSCISQVEAPSSSSSCLIDDVLSTLLISTSSVKHSASQDEDESLLFGLSLLPADSDDESLKFSYSDSEDKSDSEGESDSDFYFSDIPDDHEYSDDVVFDYNDLVVNDVVADVIPLQAPPALRFTVAPPSETNVRAVATNTPPIEMADAPLSISGAAMEVPPRKTSMKGELEPVLKSRWQLLGHAVGGSEVGLCDYTVHRIIFDNDDNDDRDDMSKLFNSQDVDELDVIAPTAPPSQPITRTERVNRKRQSRLQRELESSLDGVKWSSGTASPSLPITGTGRVQRQRKRQSRL